MQLSGEDLAKLRHMINETFKEDVYIANYNQSHVGPGVNLNVFLRRSRDAGDTGKTEMLSAQVSGIKTDSGGSMTLRVYGRDQLSRAIRDLKMNSIKADSATILRDFCEGIILCGDKDKDKIAAGIMYHPSQRRENLMEPRKIEVAKVIESAAPSVNRIKEELDAKAKSKAKGTFMDLLRMSKKGE